MAFAIFACFALCGAWVKLLHLNEISYILTSDNYHLEFQSNEYLHDTVIAFQKIVLRLSRVFKSEGIKSQNFYLKLLVLFFIKLLVFIFETLMKLFCNKNLNSCRAKVSIFGGASVFCKSGIQIGGGKMYFEEKFEVLETTSVLSSRIMNGLT